MTLPGGYIMKQVKLPIASSDRMLGYHSIMIRPVADVSTWPLPLACSDEEHGRLNGSPHVRAATSAALYGLDLARCTAAEDEVPEVELAITFEDGVGTTRTVSPEEVRFATGRAPGIGCRISGTIRFLPGPDGIATDLSYVARVTAVTAAGSEQVFEVTARFERFAFVARRSLG